MAHDFGPRVGQGIDGVTEAVDQTLIAALEGFVEDLMDDFDDLVVRRLNADASMICSIIKDTRMLAPRGAALSGADGAGHTGVNIGVGRRNDDVSEGRVSTAAVIGMEEEQEIEELRFFWGELTVRTQHG